jgi:hypothetical protein
MDEGDTTNACTCHLPKPDHGITNVAKTKNTRLQKIAAQVLRTYTAVKKNIKLIEM